MPPKVKIAKEAIIKAAFYLLKEHGIGEVNARALAKRLNCSIQPIFRTFRTMENLKVELYRHVDQVFEKFMEDGMQKHPNAFRGMGLSYIEFAKTEKYLFKFLFMNDVFKGKNLIQMIKEESNQEIIGLISTRTELTFHDAQDLFFNIWLVTHGIASLMATNDCDLKADQIETILSDAFTGFQMQFKIKKSSKNQE